MHYAFHPVAREEFRHAIEYYEERRAGLGIAFTTEIQAAVERVILYPKLWPFVYEDIRRCLVRRFPYGILYHYAEDRDEVLILAVMHLNRDPDYWKDRT